MTLSSLILIKVLVLESLTKIEKIYQVPSKAGLILDSGLMQDKQPYEEEEGKKKMVEGKSGTGTKVKILVKAKISAVHVRLPRPLYNP